MASDRTRSHGEDIFGDALTAHNTEGGSGGGGGLESAICRVTPPPVGIVIEENGFMILEESGFMILKRGTASPTEGRHTDESLDCLDEAIEAVMVADRTTEEIEERDGHPARFSGVGGFVPTPITADDFASIATDDSLATGDSNGAGDSPGADDSPAPIEAHMPHRIRSIVDDEMMRSIRRIARHAVRQAFRLP